MYSHRRIIIIVIYLSSSFAKASSFKRSGDSPLAVKQQKRTDNREPLRVHQFALSSPTQFAHTDRRPSANRVLHPSVHRTRGHDDDEGDDDLMMLPSNDVRLMIETHYSF